MMLFPTTHDPIEDDPFVIQARAEEEAREQRWAEFTGFVKCAHVPVLLRHVANVMEGHADPYMVDTAVYHQLTGFAETEGWPGVLTAIASAMREAEQAQQELMDRR